MGLDLDSLTDDLLAGLPPGPDWSLLLEIGSTRHLVRVVDGALRHEGAPGINATWDVGFAVTDEEWAAFCADPPPRGATSAQALVATRGSERITGRREVWARAAPAIDRFLAALRGTTTPKRPDPPKPPPGFGPTVGRYLHLDDGRRIFVETAGEGPPLLCLHTAGADSRQFRGLLEDPRVTDHHQVIAFDMPWHGRSDPPDDWQHRRYTLDTATYASTVLAVADALALDRPVLLGCSMGGAIALYLAAEHGERFRGVCALEGGLGSPGRFVEWTHRADVDHSAFLTSWVGGLIAPGSPEGPRARTLWGYASNGPGVYQGDTAFYSIDFPPIAAQLGRATCPLHVFSGEYDYSATTEMSRRAAEQLGGELVVMTGRGHFPMSEDPEGLLEYLLPVLEKLR
ncbi:pimeloyl-ACP methyl ester carboxylesterase [Actinomycetospora succinea]|uniref:Pimeloyl-ACP methyl ester carboxylesterase n=1 Tax=Actinomycetospora succinea TaxID=663603 RepID=A0A4R6VI79_9PSEU|nr:alpha/beta hydrolase [Actinomycetospora succinea]TDQ61190.1 pimeloyl-ACP methyl ester carboxylesterase [Actinomycetospora succinea]